jgi:uncharacterized protein (TIGR00725 family)
MMASYLAGRLIAERKWILLTGGELPKKRNIDLEVKDASMLGADDVAPGRARLIGILPKGNRTLELNGRRLLVHTGLLHNVRNVINGRTPDVIVAFGGSRGTLAEIAFAKACGRPVIFTLGSLKELREKCLERFEKDDDATKKNMTEYFDDALKVYPDPEGRSSVELLDMLRATLNTAYEVYNLRAAIRAVIEKGTWLTNRTGFPGLPENPKGTEEEFQNLVEVISL